MKKIAIAVSALLMGCSLMACGSSEGSSEYSTQIPESTEHNLIVKQEENQVLSLASGKESDYEYDEENDHFIAEVTYPIFALQEETRERFPTLEKTLNTINAVKKTKQLEEYHSFLQQAKEHFAEEPDNFYPYEFQEEVLVRRADHKSLSLLFHGYSYAGGAHSDYYLWGENYDPSTGARIRLFHVVKDMEGLKKLIIEDLNKNWSDSAFFDDVETTVDQQFEVSNEENLSWTIDYNGITFYFNPYSIAAFASGIQTVTIPFAGNELIFHEKYMDTPKSYGVQLKYNEPFFYDLNGDGEKEKISVYGEQNEYGSFSSQTICINDVEYKNDLEGYTIEPTFLHTEDGRNYLYVQNLSDNDYRIMTVYAIGMSEDSKVSIDKVETLGAGYESVIPEVENEPWLHMVLTNPESFTMETPTDMLSTCSGIKHYNMGENGLPATKDEMYRFKMERTFTLKRDLNVMILDSDQTETGENITIEAGSKVIYYGTDNVEYAELLLEDGRIARVKVKRGPWPITIDGVDIEEIFDGIVFAG